MKLGLLLPLLTGMIAWTAEARTWTDVFGRTVEADYVSTTGETVTIRRTEDGKEFHLMTEQLSKEDRHWVKTQEEAIDASLRIVQVLGNGVLAEGEGRVGPVQKIPYTRTIRERGTGLDAHLMKERQVVEYRTTRERVNLGDLFFVVCNTEGLVDDQAIGAKMWPAGTYAYTNTLGARRTVRKFTTVRPAMPVETEEPIAGQPDGQ